MGSALDIKHEQRLKALQKQGGNRHCFVCSALGTQYVVPTCGVFVCTECSGVCMACSLRVKSIAMGRFNPEEVRMVEDNGNEIAASKYLAKWANEGDAARPVDRNKRKVEAWIRAVLVDKRYYSESGEPAHRNSNSGIPVKPLSELLGKGSNSIKVSPTASASASSSVPSLQQRSSFQSSSYKAQSTGASEHFDPFGDAPTPIPAQAPAAPKPAAAAPAPASFDPFAAPAKPAAVTAVPAPAAPHTLAKPLPPPAPAAAFAPFAATAKPAVQAPAVSIPAPAAPKASAAPAADFDPFGDSTFVSAPAPKAVAPVAHAAAASHSAPAAPALQPPPSAAGHVMPAAPAAPKPFAPTVAVNRDPFAVMAAAPSPTTTQAAAPVPSGWGAPAPTSAPGATFGPFSAASTAPAFPHAPAPTQPVPAAPAPTASASSGADWSAFEDAGPAFAAPPVHAPAAAPAASTAPAAASATGFDPFGADNAFPPPPAPAAAAVSQPPSARPTTSAGGSAGAAGAGGSTGSTGSGPGVREALPEDLFCEPIQPAGMGVGVGAHAPAMPPGHAPGMQAPAAPAAQPQWGMVPPQPQQPQWVAPQQQMQQPQWAMPQQPVAQQLQWGAPQQLPPQQPVGTSGPMPPAWGSAPLPAHTVSAPGGVPYGNGFGAPSSSMHTHDAQPPVHAPHSQPGGHMPTYAGYEMPNGLGAGMNGHAPTMGPAMGHVHPQQFQMQPAPAPPTAQPAATAQHQFVAFAGQPQQAPPFTPGPAPGQVPANGGSPMSSNGDFGTFTGAGAGAGTSAPPYSPASYGAFTGAGTSTSPVTHTPGHSSPEPLQMQVPQQAAPADFAFADLVELKKALPTPAQPAAPSGNPFL